ncbi:MAG TPA: hypothetical protein DD939_12905 [Sulfitobacter pontiacus]|jgi:Rod binding domain-containing protein|uniref:hypothetical protein n=1 Tax=Sulfitobacter TaxID=60136 RepID=UPI000066AB7D|nr:MULTISPECIES: hypothetical protein [unclassified Sulfitobacter]MAJ77410.1 hypothetical protein [Roseobacter sp.]MCP3882300.1 hypothetical protein [Sulfitobacter sp.]PTB92456.1 hypothetical protein C9974_12590 [Marinobacter sp. B9-2]HBR38184.1 hypothetical protein [Sulfitobacter pontiacus]AXI52642.1 hypothetical protein C1J04_16805 [Sulfitobacter sp. SK025]|tara:strand:- start:91 stop:393 length:303 start_codon:yes stop_codon:yes gene_type:complete
MTGSIPPSLPVFDIAKPDRAAQTGKEFEKVFLTQFVDEMMKTAGASAFGGEQQADMWRSFMSEAVAGQLVEQGGLGFSGSVSQMLDAYGQGKAKFAEQGE